MGTDILPALALGIEKPEAGIIVNRRGRVSNRYWIVHY